MSSNKSVRMQLEKRYGKQCFIERLHLRKGKKERYTSKGQAKRMRQLTYHHILEKCQGGKATIENGALLSFENHAWFNQQSKENQARMNEAFQQYKALVDECKIVLVDTIDTPYKIVATDFVIEEQVDKKYNRAKKKAMDRKLAEEYVDR